MTILIIDDDDVSCEAVIRSVKKQGVNTPVVTARDGLEGLEILKNLHPSKHINGPHIVLLDLNMPRMNGFEFLREIRSDEKLKSTVVFILSTSNNKKDVLNAYNKQVAGYMTKSSQGTHFQSLGKLISDYNSAITLVDTAQ